MRATREATDRRIALQTSRIDAYAALCMKVLNLQGRILDVNQAAFVIAEGPPMETVTDG